MVLKKNMKSILLLITLSLVSFPTGDIDWLNSNGRKKLEQSISKIWKDQIITKEEIKIPLATQKLIGSKVKDQSVFKIVVDQKTEGFLFLDSKRSKFDVFDYMVLLNKDLTIKKVKILVYREDYGGEICSPAFLKQFRGKSYDSEIKLGQDIQGVSGATISCRSAISGIKIITKKAKILKKEGYLN